LETLIAPEAYEGLLAYINQEARSEVPITVLADAVEVFHSDDG
jgi:hypothetical protein